jgi:hypothetical protein
MSYRKLNHYHKTILVATYVKNIMLIANIVCGGEFCLNVRKVLPLCFLSDVIPTFKSSL